MNDEKTQQPQGPEVPDKKEWGKPVLYSHDLEETGSGPSTFSAEDDGTYSPPPISGPV